MIDTAKGVGMSALALTDTNGMYGLIQFAQLAKESNIKPILGVYLDDPNDPEINAVLLAKNRDGYSKICELITQRQLEEGFSLVEALSPQKNKEMLKRVQHDTDKLNDLVIITSSIKLLRQLKICNLHFSIMVISTSKCFSRRNGRNSAANFTILPANITCRSLRQMQFILLVMKII